MGGWHSDGRVRHCKMYTVDVMDIINPMSGSSQMLYNILLLDINCSASLPLPCHQRRSRPAGILGHTPRPYPPKDADWDDSF